MKTRSMSKPVFTMAALFMIFLTCSSASAEQKPKSPSEIMEGQEQEKTIDVEEKGSVEAGKSDVSLHVVDEQKKPAELDRRWIIKMRDEKDRKVTVPKPEQIPWSGKEQKSLCETYTVRLRESFSMTRHYSIHGDSCSTARNARAFLDLIEQCSRDCPEGYAGSKGYSAKAIQNVEVLHELGRKRCFQAVTESGPGKSESRPGNAENQNTTHKKVQQRDRD